MSSYSIIRDTSLELRRRIHSALSTAQDADLGLTTPEEDITFSLASDDLDGPRLSLYLYRLEPEGSLRNQRPLPAADTGLRSPPLALQLHYLIIPLDDAEDTNHLMLGRILQYFHDRPFLESLNGAPLGDSHGGNSPEARVVLETLTVEQQSHVWSALHTEYRLSIGYLVRAVAIDTAEPVTPARRVVEALTAVGHKGG